MHPKFESQQHQPAYFFSMLFVKIYRPAPLLVSIIVSLLLENFISVSRLILISFISQFHNICLCTYFLFNNSNKHTKYLLKTVFFLNYYFNIFSWFSFTESWKIYTAFSPISYFYTTLALISRTKQFYIFSMTCSAQQATATFKVAN